jgi:AraC-like DNA-binding protein
MLLNISNYLCLPFQLKVNYYLWSQNHIGHEPHLGSSVFFFSPLMKLLPIVVLVCYIIYSGVYLFREYRKESFLRKIKMLQFLSQFVLLAFLNYIPFLVIIGILIEINGITSTYLFRFPSGFSLDYLNIISLALPLSFFLFPDFLFGRESKFFSKSAYFNRLLTSNSALEAQSNFTQVDSDFTLIEAYMMSQKPYLSVDFSVQKIAQELQIPRNRISEAFSIKLKRSFPQYRNQLRILYSIDMLKENYHKNYSIEGIAIKSGFKNKSTFYSAFKIETGQTPIDWIKENMS